MQTLGDWIALASLVVMLLGGGGLVPLLNKIAVGLSKIDKIERDVECHDDQIAALDRRVTRIEPRREGV